MIADPLTQPATRFSELFDPQKPVILAGFAPSHLEVERLPVEIDLWSCNHAWEFFKRLDAVFEIHPYQYLQDPAYYANKVTETAHIAWLKEPHEFPIYMIEPIPDVPASVRYPIEDALELASMGVQSELAIDSRYFSSSFAYMIAKAILENRNPIYVYGFDMAADTEWHYQRANTEYWIGLARGMGFDVQVARTSPLCKVSKMYGYEGYQMIDRHVLESRKNGYTDQFEQAREQFDKWQGILLERYRLHRPKKEIDEAAEQVRLYENTAAMCDGALQAVKNLLDECDLVPADIPVFQMRHVRD